MNGLRMSVTGLRDKPMSLLMGTGFPKDSKQGRFPAPSHDETRVSKGGTSDAYGKMDKPYPSFLERTLLLPF